ncbi:DUF6056 family protein [Streptomyces sp. NBC_01431]|uniref:DUF6056 family protein n=1 Tax=Streptomyces sp. NBC_01431 TaxID=2903863 RepID=UPI002E348D3E|nr:DUF6056 family protein [Streptomyces sp. NBC_01431]
MNSSTTVAADDSAAQAPSSTGDRSERSGARRALLWTAGIITAATGVLLSVGAFLGLYVRPTSDDWCAAWKSRDMGVFGITSDFYNTQNGRVTNAFLSGIIYSDGLFGIKVLPVILVVTMGVGLVLLGREILRLFGMRAPLLLLVAVTMVLEALLFFAGTRSYQVLLWTPATISHTMPFIIALWALLFGIWAFRTGRKSLRNTALVLTGVVGFAIGTLSEPFTVVSCVLVGTAALVCLPRLRVAKSWYPFTWSAVYCAAAVIGLAFLYTSPGARWRRAQTPPTKMSVGDVLKDYFHIWDTILHQWIYLGAVAAGLLLGLAVAFLAPRRESPAVSRPPAVMMRVIAILPVPLIALCTLLVAYALRDGYGPTGWTYARTWMNFMIPLVIALCGYGVLLGHWAGRHIIERRLPRAVPVVATLLVGAFALSATAALVPSVQKLAVSTVYRSIAWDKQNTKIRSEIAKGETDVEYKPMYIGSLAEPFFTKNYKRDWVAQCTSKYYGVDRIHKP